MVCSRTHWQWAMGLADDNLVWQIFSFERESVVGPRATKKHDAKKNTKCQRSDSVGFLLRGKILKDSSSRRGGRVSVVVLHFSLLIW